MPEIKNWIWEWACWCYLL